MHQGALTFFISHFMLILQLRKVKKSEATLAGELTPYNIVPLDAPSMTNLIGQFPEVRTEFDILILFALCTFFFLYFQYRLR